MDKKLKENLMRFATSANKKQKGVMSGEISKTKPVKKSIMISCAYIIAVIAIMQTIPKETVEAEVVPDTEVCISEETQQGVYTYTPVYVTDFKGSKPTSEETVVEANAVNGGTEVDNPKEKVSDTAKVDSKSAKSENTKEAKNTTKTKAKVDTKTETESEKLDSKAKYDAAKKKSDAKKSKWYIPVITLDYPWETFEMPYEHQKLVYDTCTEKGLDYWQIMGIIARESRFDPTCVTGDHVGYMQICTDAVTDMRKRLGNHKLDRNDPEDNIILGIELYDYMLERTDGDEYAAHWAYCSGYGGYTKEKRNGATSNIHADKAYKFAKMLKDETLNPRE